MIYVQSYSSCLFNMHAHTHASTPQGLPQQLFSEVAVCTCQGSSI